MQHVLFAGRAWLALRLTRGCAAASARRCSWQRLTSLATGTPIWGSCFGRWASIIVPWPSSAAWFSLSCCQSWFAAPIKAADVTQRRIRVFADAQELQTATHGGAGAAHRHRHLRGLSKKHCGGSCQVLHTCSIGTHDCATGRRGAPGRHKVAVPGGDVSVHKAAADAAQGPEARPGLPEGGPAGAQHAAHDGQHGGADAAELYVDGCHSLIAAPVEDIISRVPTHSLGSM